MLLSYKLFEYRKISSTDEYDKHLDYYLHKKLSHSDTVINPLTDDFLEKFMYIDNPTDKELASINKYLKSHKLDNIVLYHGTHPDNNILDEGLLKTTTNRRLSRQSSSGFVYLALFPDSAKQYSDIGYGISNSAVYKITVPIEYLKPDDDNLKNVRQYGKIDVGTTLADSFIYAHTFRVAGNIPPYMIKKYIK